MNTARRELRQLSAELDCLVEALQLERIKLGLPIDVVDMARDRRTLEDRLALAFEDIDLEDMPSQWSWEQAVLSLAQHIVVTMLYEPRESKRGRLH